MRRGGHWCPHCMIDQASYLLAFEGHYLLGQIIFNDGGTDALMRPDAF